MWEPRRLTTVWAFTACYTAIALPLPFQLICAFTRFEVLAAVTVKIIVLCVTWCGLVDRYHLSEGTCYLRLHCIHSVHDESYNKFPGTELVSLSRI
jgi:hypothetical protein